MASKKFIEAAQNLSKSAIIAIESLKKYPPKYWETGELNHVVICYNERLFFINNPEPKFQNMRSLKYLEEEVFTRFQEGTGEDVEEFWKRIKEENLPFKRENKMAKILKRKKINNDIEYDFITDVIVPYQQEAIITEEEAVLLNNYLGNFENRQKK